MEMLEPILNFAGWSLGTIGIIFAAFGPHPED